MNTVNAMALHAVCCGTEKPKGTLKQMAHVDRVVKVVFGMHAFIDSGGTS